MRLRQVIWSQRKEKETWALFYRALSAQDGLVWEEKKARKGIIYFGIEERLKSEGNRSRFDTMRAIWCIAAITNCILSRW